MEVVDVPQSLDPGRGALGQEPTVVRLPTDTQKGLPVTHKPTKLMERELLADSSVPHWKRDS